MALPIPQYKVDLELKVIGDRTFINYWDLIFGGDIVVEVRDGKLIENGKEISLQEFIDKVMKQVKKY